MPAAPPLRVIQWATGAVGGYALRSVITRPEFELAGVLVHDKDKVGRDAGELVGLTKAGVACTGDAEEVLALDADCVLYMPLPASCSGGDPASDVETICALLSSGKNVVTTTGFVYPLSYGPLVVERLEAACAGGGTSLHGTGINPGFMSDLLPLALSGLSARLDHIFVRETSDFRGHPSPQVVAGLMGFTRSPGEYESGIRPFRAFQRSQFGQSVRLVAAALGVRLDEVEETDEYELATEEFDIAAGTVRPGTVCASRWVSAGMVRGRPFMTVECVFKADARKVRRWSAPGFAIHIEGRPGMAIRIDEVTHGLEGAAAHAVNSIAAVCAAPPGIRTMLDLPLPIGHGAVRLA